MTFTRYRAPLLVAFGLALGAWLIYLGVSATAPESAPTGDLKAAELKFAPWEQATWSRAASRPALVFLLVSDSTSPRALELESLLLQPPLSTTLATQFLAVRIDRRHRPDLAERYAENQVPHLSVLLPTGEALARLSGEPDTWTEQLVETTRYWRDHQEELAERAEAFWQSQAEAEARASVEAPVGAESDLRPVDSAVFGLVNALLQEHSGAALWRTDLDRYLSVRGSREADSLHAALRAARRSRLSELESAASLGATRAEWLRTVLELHHFGGLDSSADPLSRARAEWRRSGPAVTAEESALELQLIAASGESPQPHFQGSWLGLEPGGMASLPHRPENAELDGYLMDALAWLECLLGFDDPAARASSVRLADSLWAGLWDAQRQALRDKPVREGYLRETQVYPRAQLGRAATLLGKLALVTGDRRFAARADSCLAGFAPYVGQAGAAATFYGEAILRRAGAS